MNKKYLTPSVSELYQAPRGLSPLYYTKAGIHRVSGTIAYIDVKNELGSITQSEANQLLNTVRLTAAETIQRN